MNLSFADASFDAVTIAFGLRNFSNWQDGLRELHRVTKKGGRLVILEFSTPVVPGFKQIFNLYFTRILPRVGGAVSGSRGAYEYLPDSVSRFPDQKGLAEMMRETGFDQVEYVNLTGGIAAIHSGIKS
jgi:demethylmenaquinone methyltransferase/2-methoxy-6-polyprenyl-1,4-benzoquinol methylase